MLHRLLSAAGLTLILATPALALRVDFYPAQRIHSYEMDAARGARSLLLQNVAVRNDGATPVTLDHVTIELLDKGHVVDARTLDSVTLAGTAAGGAAMQKQGLIELLAFQFGGTALLPSGTTLSEDLVLNPGEALLVTSQLFAYRGVRDTLVVRVNEHAAEGRLPIVTNETRIAYSFPVQGTWYVANGASLHTGHRWTPMEEFALDLVKLDTLMRTHRAEGTRFSDFLAYGQSVHAAADGRVVSVVTDQTEDAKSLQQPGETIDAYLERLQQSQFERISKGIAAVGGNQIVIDHGNGEYSFYAHLQPGSVLVKVGDQVRRGQRIGTVGSTGNSTEPHLHFQIQDQADPFKAAAIPIQWKDLELISPDGPRALQSGDPVFARAGR